MNSDYVLLSLYLGEFAPTELAYENNHNFRFILSNLRFLLSRLLTAKGFNYIHVDSLDTSEVNDQIPRKSPYITINRNPNSNHEMYSFFPNECPATLDIKRLLEAFLDDDLVAEQIRELLSLPLKSRDNVLWELHKPYEEHIPFSIGYGSISPITPYLAIAERIRFNKIKITPSKLIREYELLAIAGSAILFNCIDQNSSTSHCSSDAYLVAMAAYTKLVTTPAELERLELCSKRLSKQASLTEPAREQSKQKRKEDKQNNKIKLVEAAVEVRNKYLKLSIAKIVEELIANFRHAHRNVLSHSLNKPCLGLYSEATAIKVLNGFSGHYRQALENLGSQNDIGALKTEVLKLML